MAERSITELPELRAALSAEDAATFDRLFLVERTTGQLLVPEPMVDWVEDTYRSVDAVSTQTIVKVVNRWTLQTALFNPFRALRPQKDGDSDSLAEEIFGDGPDPFDDPENETTEDSFGRVHGEHCVTASNLAKSDASHGVIAFREHNPWVVTEDALWDAFQVATEWFARNQQANPAAIYPLLIWNCLWKAGASINHAHMQLLATSGMHYGEIERLRYTTERYAARYEGASYYDDLYSVHAAVGLGRQHQGVRFFAHLNPLLAHECVFLADEVNEPLARTIHRVIKLLNQEFSVKSFNLAVMPHPLAATEEDWSQMPVVARIVSRGNPQSRTIDTGAMELFAASVISTDPFALGALLDRVCY